jgi:C_GCAxxG_C_C family probable redox protein
MDQKSALPEKATNLFLNGYNCAQSVLLAMFEHWNCKNDLIPKIASGFGGGIGMCGSTRGALIGGVMALSIKYGSNDPSAEKRQECYRLVKNLYKQFEAKHGTVLCRQLIEYDLSTRKGLEEARKANVFDEKCPIFVRTVIQVLIDIDERAV